MSQGFSTKTNRSCANWNQSLSAAIVNTGRASCPPRLSSPDYPLPLVGEDIVVFWELWKMLNVFWLQQPTTPLLDTQPFHSRAGPRFPVLPPSDVQWDTLCSLPTTGIPDICQSIWTHRLCSLSFFQVQAVEPVLFSKYVPPLLFCSFHSFSMYCVSL